MVRPSHHHTDAADTNGFVISAIRPGISEENLPSPSHSPAKNENHRSKPCTQDLEEGHLLSSPSECTPPPPGSPKSPHQVQPVALLPSMQPLQDTTPPHAAVPTKPRNESAPALASLSCTPSESADEFASMPPVDPTAPPESSLAFGSLSSKGPHESADEFNARIGLGLGFRIDFSFRTPPTPPKASAPSVSSPQVAPPLVAGYDSNSDDGNTSGSGSERDTPSPPPVYSKSKNAIRPRKSLKKKARRVRFAEEVEIRYIPTNRSNREREAQFMQQEFADFIDSMPISIAFADDTNGNSVENDMFSFEEDLKAINSILIDTCDEDDDFHLVDSEDKADEAEQKELENRVECLRNKLKRPRDNNDAGYEFDIKDEQDTKEFARNRGLDTEVLNILSARRHNKKRKVLAPSNNSTNFNHNNNKKCANPSTLLNMNGTTKADNDTTTVAN